MCHWTHHQLLYKWNNDNEEIIGGYWSTFFWKECDEFILFMFLFLSFLGICPYCGCNILYISCQVCEMCVAYYFIVKRQNGQKEMPWWAEEWITYHLLLGNYVLLSVFILQENLSFLILFFFFFFFLQCFGCWS